MKDVYNVWKQNRKRKKGRDKSDSERTKNKTGNERVTQIKER
jgi:hypothetical protein